MGRWFAREMRYYEAFGTFCRAKFITDRVYVMNHAGLQLLDIWAPLLGITGVKYAAE